MQAKLFLVDVDGTLLDSQKTKEAVGASFTKQFGEASIIKFQEAYKDIIAKRGFLDIPGISIKLASELKTDSSTIEKIFLNLPFKDFLFPGALDFLKNLQSQGKVLIYSQGDDLYQPLKIKNSGIEETVGAENVIIREDKAKYFPEFKKEIEKENFSEITIIDNSEDILESGRKVFPEAKLVLAGEGKYNI